jgi:hypothetical protein
MLPPLPSSDFRPEGMTGGMASFGPLVITRKGSRMKGAKEARRKAEMQVRLAKLKSLGPGFSQRSPYKAKDPTR